MKNSCSGFVLPLVAALLSIFLLLSLAAYHQVNEILTFWRETSLSLKSRNSARNFQIQQLPNIDINNLRPERDLGITSPLRCIYQPIAALPNQQVSKLCLSISFAQAGSIAFTSIDGGSLKRPTEFPDFKIGPYLIAAKSCLKSIKRSGSKTANGNLLSLGSQRSGFTCDVSDFSVASSTSILGNLESKSRFTIPASQTTRTLIVTGFVDLTQIKLEAASTILLAAGDIHIGNIVSDLKTLPVVTLISTSGQIHIAPGNSTVMVGQIAFRGITELKPAASAENFPVPIKTSSNVLGFIER